MLPTIVGGSSTSTSPSIPRPSGPLSRSDAFPDDSAPSHLLRDREQVYGEQFRHRVKGMRIEEVLTALHSPWQNPFAERLIGSIRRECLNHVIVRGERHLRRILTSLDFHGQKLT